MPCLPNLQTRLNGSSASPPKPTTPTATPPSKPHPPETPPRLSSTPQPPDTPPSRRRRLHGRRPSGAPPNCPTDRNTSPTPPFVPRLTRPARARSLPTPREIADSVVYAQACGAYLCGQAESVRLLLAAADARGGGCRTTPSPSHDDDNDDPASKAFATALRQLRADFARFEADQVAWAGYLMEGSAADGGDPARARRFVQEGLAVIGAVDRARGAVDRAG